MPKLQRVGEAWHLVALITQSSQVQILHPLPENTARFGGFFYFSLSMNLIDNWKAVAIKAWSMRLVVLSAILSGAEVALPLFDDAFRRGTFALLAVVVSLAAAVARIVSQPELHK